MFCFLLDWLVLELAGVPVTAVKGAYIMCSTTYVHFSFRKLIRKCIHDNRKFILEFTGFLAGLSEAWFLNSVKNDSFVS